MLDVTADEIVNTLLLERRPEGPSIALVVEGPEDFHLMSMHLDHSAVSLTVAYSKSAALGTAAIATNEGYSWIYTAVDADFDRVTGAAITTPLLGYSDHYDLAIDALMADPTILETLVLGLLDAAAIQNYRQDFSTGASETLLSAIEEIGRLRYAVKVDASVSLSTRKWRPNGLIDAALLGSQRAHVATQAEARCGNTVPAAQLHVIIGTAAQTVRREHLYCGHDLIDIVIDLLRRYQTPPSREVVEASFRNLVRCPVFRSLPVVHSVRMWANMHGVTAWHC